VKSNLAMCEFGRLSSTQKGRIKCKCYRCSSCSYE